MPRIRTVKPEFWGDEKLARLDPLTRLVFLGLIGMADDAGRLLDNVKAIDGFIFPMTADTAETALNTLANLSRIIRYESTSGQPLIQISKWKDHQKVDHPNPHSFPPPPLARRSRKVRASTNDQRPTTSTNDQGPGSVSWPAELAALLKPIGLFPIPRVGRELKPLVTEYGWERAREMVDAYARFAPHLDRNGNVDPNINAPQFCSPKKLVENADFWFKYTEPIRAT